MTPRWVQHSQCVSSSHTCQTLKPQASIALLTQAAAKEEQEEKPKRAAGSSKEEAPAKRTRAQKEEPKVHQVECAALTSAAAVWSSQNQKTPGVTG